MAPVLTTWPPRERQSERVVLTGRSNYWQPDEPAIGQLVFPAFSNSNAVVSA